MNSVKLPLVTRTGEPGTRSGLNWGQRNTRDPNQAYIPIPVEHRSFFPARGLPFTCHTDDGRQLTLVVAQLVRLSPTAPEPETKPDPDIVYLREAGKALHTPHENSELGRYFRRRLGLRSGTFVTRKHLDAYGRTDVEFGRISETVYYLDFSKP